MGSGCCELLQLGERMELEQIKGLLDLANLEDITAIKKAYAK